MNITNLRILSAFMALLLVFAGTSAFAQITAQTGAITGSVTDPSGAVVPKADISVTSSRGTTLSRVSSADGSFTFPLLEPGTYQVTVKASGFQSTTISNVAVRITDVTNLPVHLQVGSESTEVVVTSAAPLVNVSNSTLGQVLTADELSKLPLSSRNFTNLLALNTGVSASLPDASAAGRGSVPGIFVNGQRGTYNNLVINGVDANNLGNNNFGNVPIPSPDTIEEFRVQTSLYDASQGKTSGGNVNVITKGGQAKYHGELYEFLRNDALNANEWFLAHSNKPKAILKKNQFGGNFGGPVPKWKKTFFFGSYQGTRERNGLSGAVTGAFPVLPAVRSRANIEAAFGLAPGTASPVALKLLNLPGQFGGFLVPTGTGVTPAPGTNGTNFGAVAYSAPLKYSDNQFNANLDTQITDKQRLSFRYFRAVGITEDPFGGQGAGGLGIGETRPVTNHLASISWTNVISPRLINEARVGFNRIQSATAGKDPATVADIGMTRFNSSVYSGIPLLFTNDAGPSFGGISTNNDQASANSTYNLADTLAWTQGKHTFRFGAEYRRYQINLFNNFASRGFLSFNTFQDFVQGNVTQQAFVGTGQTDRGFRARDLAFYFQDDWKVSPRLTLNLGIRWDYLGPSVDVKDRIGNFDPSRLDAATLATGGPGLLNGFILPESADFGAIKGTPGVDRSTYNNVDHNNFAPRLGFAYDVFGNGKTSIRGGYGVYFVRVSNQTLLQLITAVPFFQLSSVVSPGTTLDNPFPSGLALPSQFPIFPATPAFTGFSAAGTPTFSAPLLSLNPIDRNLRTPYAEHYNLTIQQELPWKLGLEVGYIGSQGVKLLHSRQVNQASLANAANPIRGLTANASRNVNARVPVIGFSSTGMNEVTGSGASNYNALITSLNRRSENLFLQVSYTYAKSIDNNSGSATQDLGNSGGNQIDLTSGLRSLSDFDRQNRLQVTYRYGLPGFKTGALSRVLGGWEVGGLTTYQSGLPIAFSCSPCSSSNLFGQSGSFPNLIAPISGLEKGGDPHQYIDAGGAAGAFNTNVLAAPSVLALGTTFGNLNTFGGPGTQTFTIGGPGTGSRTGSLFGTLGRNPGPRGQFQQQWDLYIGKNIKVREGLNANFRTELFNAFNHPVFNRPNASVGSSQFGRITSTATTARIIQFALKLQF